MQITANQKVETQAFTYQPSAEADASAAPIKGPIPFDRAATAPFRSQYGHHRYIAGI
jgi:hypothetical protein